MAVSNKAPSTLTIDRAAAAFDDPINGPRYDNERDKSKEREREREREREDCRSARDVSLIGRSL